MTTKQTFGTLFTAKDPADRIAVVINANKLATETLVAGGKTRIDIRRNAGRIYIRPVEGDRGLPTTTQDRGRRRICVSQAKAAQTGLEDLIGQRFTIRKVSLPAVKTANGTIDQKWFELRRHSKVDEPLVAPVTEQILTIARR